ncbi:MAG: gluconate transporter [Blastopirellula sp.]|nr:MAG: gluconate transporter [Blastopirellula sp.]
MDSLLIVLIGVAIVIGGVLLFRLHAFLALTLAALAVSVLTPRSSVDKFYLDKNKIKFVISEEDSNTFQLNLSKRDDLHQSQNFLIMRPGSGWSLAEEVGELKVSHFDRNILADGSTQTLANASPVDHYSYQESDIIVHATDRAAAEKAASKTVGERVAEAFGSTCTKIAILIAMASIIGKCLLDSGSADRIIRSSLNVVGEKGAPIAFIFSGFLLAIPVFFDTVFYLMIPLAKALRMRTGKNYLLYVLTIIIGGTMAHSLVPPTPGPLIVVEQFNLDIGTMILGGCIVGLFTSTAGYFYAITINKFWVLPLRETPDMSLEDLKLIVAKDESELPPLWISLLPIILPVVLIAGYTILKILLGSEDSFLSGILGSSSDTVMYLAKTFGNKNIALGISAVIAMLTMVVYCKTTKKELAKSVQTALASGGVVILITAAGGAFGGMLRETGIADYLSGMTSQEPFIILLIAYGLTMAIRTAQGSSTVAMITAAGILSPMATAEMLDFHPVYLALAVGCGSKPIAWMNDSGFWIMCKMSGMTEIEGLKAITPMSLFISVVGLLVTIVGAMWLPLD